MKREKANSHGEPDPHALGIAAAAQKAVEPDPVILFGSRAVGTHRADSDVDILVVADREDHRTSSARAVQAARSHMKGNPPKVELGIISMTRREFDRCRLANQHIAGQAALHGVVMAGGKLELGHNRDNHYPDHWRATKQCIRQAEEFRRTCDEMVDKDDWNRMLIEYCAQQSVENALRGWLSAHNDPGWYGHDLDAMWRRINELEDWSVPKLQRLQESVLDLFQHTAYADPDTPEHMRNHLTDHSAMDGDGNLTWAVSREEQLPLHALVGRVVDDVVALIHRRSGTHDEDVYPEGFKPWEIQQHPENADGNESTAMRYSDRKALQVAWTVQRVEQPELTILFGSRARGDHREQKSDIDIMLVQAQEPDRKQQQLATRRAESAVTEIYGWDVPVQLIWRTLDKFRQRRRYINSVETQAAREGIVMPRDPETYSVRDYKDEETEYGFDWRTYAERMHHAEVHLGAFQRQVECNMDDLLIGQQAQNALEQGLKALLEAHDARYRGTDDIGELMDKVRNNDPQLRQFHLAIQPDIYSAYDREREELPRVQPLLTNQQGFRERTTADAELIINRAREVRLQREDGS